MRDLYVAQLNIDGRTRHIVCFVEPFNGGLMYEYVDPVTGEVVGSVGRDRFEEYVTPLDRWTRRVMA